MKIARTFHRFSGFAFIALAAWVAAAPVQAGTEAPFASNGPVASNGQIASADSGAPVAPSPSWDSRFLPVQLQFGPHFGFTGSRITASKEYRSALEPTPAMREPWTAPSFGLMLAARWKNGISLTLSPRHETYGVDTREETVSFPGNPFPHTLESSSELSYFVWPLLLGYGWYTPRQHIQFQAGAYTASLDHAETKWTVDGEPYAGSPQPQYRSGQSGWLLAIEYGYRLGPGELVFGAETQRQSESSTEGLEGSVKAKSARLSLGYAWTLMRR